MTLLMGAHQHAATPMSRRSHRGGGLEEDARRHNARIRCTATPPKPIIAHYRSALGVVAWVRHEHKRVELAQVLPELLERQWPQDAQEQRNAGVAHEV